MVYSLTHDIKQRKEYSLYKMIDLVLYEESGEIFQIRNDCVHFWRIDIYALWI